MIVKCKHCDTEIDTYFVFCHKCGEKISDSCQEKETFDQSKKTDAGKTRFDLVPERYFELHNNSDGNIKNQLFLAILNRDYFEIVTICRSILTAQHLTPYEELAKVYTFGAVKYGDNTWQTVDGGLIRYQNAMMRHFVCYNNGQNWNETDGNIHHVAQIIFNAIACDYFEKKEG